jgi:hemoglobin
MKEAHWHLHITNKQWDAFAADFKGVLDHYKVPAELQGECFKIMGGVKPDIVNESPDHVPAPPAADADADPKSLYKRLGGIYAIAAVVNDFIDVIMVDPILNANPKVQEAHHTVAPAGFKNMVTQFVASAAGGPQIYTGKNMHDAHWKLDITYAEWNQFAKDFGEVLAKFKVPKKETDELFAAVGPLKTQVAHKDL